VSCADALGALDRREAVGHGFSPMAPPPVGLPRATMATPQCAMAQLGSCFATSSKALRAGVNQKE
jgi:hypothetical protein